MDDENISKVTNINQTSFQAFAFKNIISTIVIFIYELEQIWKRFKGNQAAQ